MAVANNVEGVEGVPEDRRRTDGRCFARRNVGRETYQRKEVIAEREGGSGVIII